jgi:hypothetical protein
MKYLILLALALALSSPAWAEPEGTDADGCYTDRHWRRHCPDAVSPPRAGIKPAKARAKDRTLDTYKAMKQAKARAKAGAAKGETPAQAQGRGGDE